MAEKSDPVLKAENAPPPDPDANRPAANEGKELVSGKVVKYVGIHGAREINEEAWDAVGSKTKLIRWDASNNYTVDAAELDDVALHYCDQVDSGFVVMDAPVK
jgi:hypothetical protein